MPFERQFHTLLQKSYKNIIIKNMDSSIEVENFDTNFNLISTKKLLDGKFTFADVWFDITENNIVYGIINHDFGKTWTNPILDRTSSEHNFNCYSYKSATSDNKEHNHRVIFAQDKPFNILGIIK